MTAAEVQQASAADPFDLNRFMRAQQPVYEPALAEIRAGRKKTHWMWYLFPQIRGLGSSTTSNRYAIRGIDEAKAYLAHPVLGPRLAACCEAVLAADARSAYVIFGSPDDMKLQSCATLFAQIAPEGSVFERLLERYFDGERDAQTLDFLARAKAAD